MVIATLGIDNAEAVCVNLSAESVGEKFAVIVSRAVGSAEQLVAMLGGRLASGGSMILLTGAGDPEAGRGVARPLHLPGWSTSVRHFEIPGLDRAHEVTIIRHTGETPEVA